MTGIFPGGVSDFPTPAFGTNGNLGRGTFLGPGYADMDTSLMKNIPVYREARLQLRADVLNVFNRGNLYLPTTDLATPTLFGKSTTAFDPRRMQLALKLEF